MHRPTIVSLLKNTTSDAAKKKLSTTRSTKKFMRSKSPPQNGLHTSFTTLGMKTRMSAMRAGVGSKVSVYWSA